MAPLMAHNSSRRADAYIYRSKLGWMRSARRVLRPFYDGIDNEYVVYDEWINTIDGLNIEQHRHVHE